MQFVNKPGINTAIIDQKDIKKTIFTVLKNWYWFILFIGLGFGASVAYLYKATNYYGASAKILIKPHKNAFKDALSESLSSSGPSKDEIANEIEILSSTRMISKVITELNLDISYYIQGRLKTGEIYKGRPFVVEGTVLDDSFYGASFNLNIVGEKEYRLTVEHNEYIYNEVNKFGEPVVNDKFSLVINSDTTITKNIKQFGDTKYLFKINNHGYLVKQYQKALKLKRSTDASVIILDIEDQVQDKAIDFLKIITDEYIINSIAVQKQINENTLSFINDQLKEVEDVLNGVESSLEKFQIQKTTVNPEDEQGTYMKRKVEVESQRAALQVRLQSIDYLYQQLVSGNNVSGISPTLMGESGSGLTNAFANLNGLEQKRTNLLFSNTPSSPIVKEIEGQIATARKTVISIVMNMRRNLVVQINGLNSQIGQFRGAMNQMPSTIRGLVNIERKVAINEKIYLFLLETRAETIIEKAAIVADKFLLEPAAGTGLRRPLKTRVLIAGFGIGFALALALIFFKSLFYNFVITKDDLAELTTMPIIGVVSKSKEGKKSYLVVDKQPQSITSEAFRVIRTNMAYFSPKAHSKVVLFTSSVSGEGKTFSAINTATILAKAKKKVVVLDLDLHKPKQANAFGLKNDVGISSFLVGKSKIEEVIKESGINNLDVILSGPKSPNASELLLDPMLENLIHELKNRYDYVILDTPPVGLLSDALVLMKEADLNIYVLKSNFSKKDFVDIAHQLVEKNNIKHVSFLLNNVSAKNVPAGYGGGYYK
jgi:tyrosine-protein kinase Etk/Wzc